MGTQQVRAAAPHKELAQALPGLVLSSLREVCGSGAVGLHEPRFGGREREYLRECIDSSLVSSVGPFVDRFEAELASRTGAGHAVVVVNGTAALHLALLLADVEPGDEVLMPALTFVATANAVRACGATPHFVDCDLGTLGLDPHAVRTWLEEVAVVRDGQCVNLRTGRRIHALLPVHVFGHPCDLAGLASVARDFHLTLVEDAAESLGSYYGDRHTGTLGQLGALSFNGNKTITTGGGGAILTGDPELARRARHLSSTARLPHRWATVHDETAFNYQMPNLNAALGCAQLEQLDGFLASKRRLYNRYRDVFSGVSGVRLVAEPAGCRSNYWLQALLLDDSVADARDAVLTATNDAGLTTRPVWEPLHHLAPYRGCPRAPLPVAESIARRLINMPSGAGLA